MRRCLIAFATAMAISCAISPALARAMLASVDHLLKSDQPLPTLEGLKRWQADCGGVYTISVGRAADVMEKTLNAP